MRWTTKSTRNLGELTVSGHSVSHAVVAFLLVAAFLIITLASIALPFTNGFVGEFLILLGTFRWDPKFAALAATGVILSAVYMLWMFQRVNYGPLNNPKNRSLPDLSPREWAMVVPIVAMAIFMGVLPTCSCGRWSRRESVIERSPYNRPQVQTGLRRSAVERAGWA